MSYIPPNAHNIGSASRNLASQRGTPGQGRDEFSEVLDTTSGRVNSVREKINKERNSGGLGSNGRKATDTSHAKNILQAKQALNPQKPKAKSSSTGWSGIASSAGPKAKKVVAELVDPVESDSAADEFVPRSEFEKLKEDLANLNKTVDKLLEKGSGPGLSFGDSDIAPDSNVAYQNNNIYNAMTPNAFNRPGNFDTQA